MSAKRRDWADLPPGLIHLISQKVPDVTDFLRFRTVCKSWCSSAPLSDSPPQLPWLLECNDLWRCTELKDNLRFYSLSTQETCSIPVKQSNRSLFYHGPGSGYLFTWPTDDQFLLLNPLNNAEISVPFHLKLRCLWPIWTGSDHILSRDTAFMAMIEHRVCLAIYHHVNKKWNVMQWDGSGDYCGGMLITKNIEGDTKVFDGNSQKLLFNVPLPKYFDVRRPTVYHVELSGEILRVHYYIRHGQNPQEAVFDLYKLNRKGKDGQPCWDKVSDVDNHMLFLDFETGFSMKAPSAGIKGNCIYFFDHHTCKPYKHDIATGTIERVPCPFSASTWFVPSLS